MNRLRDTRLNAFFVVAAPRTLGEMRRRFRKPLEDALIGKLDKELTGRNAREILGALHGE